MAIDTYLTFDELQKYFALVYQDIFENDLAEKSIIIIPSLTLDNKILSKVVGHCHYEERMLCMLLLLKMPRTRVTFVSSIPISPTIIDYYIHMLPGITSQHAYERLKMIHCYDGSNLSLTEKVLNRPRLMERIRNTITNKKHAHIICFNVTEHEKKLAQILQCPIYGCDPKLNYLGSKSGCRQLFKDCGILLPKGYENLKSENDIINGVLSLKSENPQIKKVVIKLNEGFSGDGNAILKLPEDIHALSRKEWRDFIENHIKIVASDLKYKSFLKKLKEMGGIVEEFIVSEIIKSPSVQVRINPIGEIKIISTHDQVLGGESDQVYQGAIFPADAEYAQEISQISYIIAEKMRDLGVIGRWGLDFMSFKNGDIWTHYAIEINLRKGGTTHPFLMLQFLTEGDYDADSGEYFLKNGQKRYYFATDNLQDEAYKGLTPIDLLDIIMRHGLHYQHSSHEGVMFHLISALSEYGKLGMLCIAQSKKEAIDLYHDVVRIIDSEVGKC